MPVKYISHWWCPRCNMRGTVRWSYHLGERETAEGEFVLLNRINRWVYAEHEEVSPRCPKGKRTEAIRAIEWGPKPPKDDFVPDATWKDINGKS